MLLTLCPNRCEPAFICYLDRCSGGKEKMRKIVVSIAALALVIVVTGCATIPMESNVGKPVSMTNMKGTPAQNFESKSKAIWLFWGLVTLSVPTVDEVVGPAVADHAGVQNLKITMESEALDIIADILTDGILIMRTVTIEGQAYD
jgi:hypothetical protein